MKCEQLSCFETGWAALFNVDLWIKWGEIFNNFAPSIIAAVALWVAYSQLNLGFAQLKSNRIETRNATAHNLYHQYLTLCLEKPEFSNGMVHPGKDCDDYRQYCWFVSTMLFTFEQIIETQSTDEKWIRTIESQLRIHKEFLAKSSTVKEKKWNDSLQLLIEKAIANE